MSTPAKDRTLSKSDATALGVFMILGAAIAVWSTVAAIQRIIEVLPGRDVPVLALFRDTVGTAPLGPDGAAVNVTLESAWITAAELPTAAIGALVIQQVVLAAAIITVVLTLLLLTRNIMRGRVFGRTNTVLVTTAGLTALIGFALVPFFGNMGANGAFAAISDRTFDNVVMSVDFFPFIAIAFIAALSSTVFAVGARLQRETEGLV